MPEPVANQPEQTTERSGAAWALPMAIAASAAIVSVFLGWMILVTLGAMVWAAWAAARERSLAQDERWRLSREVRDSRGEAEQHERMRGVLDAAGVPIIATDAEGVITVASRSASRTLGGGRSLVGVRFDELFPQAELHELERLARGGEPGRARLKLPIEGELRTFVVSADALGRGLGGVVTLRDVTELVKAAELKADFAANASHELRTPIASIRGAAETLQGPARNDPAMSTRLIGIVANNAARLEALVNDLLDLSKLESADTAPSLGPVDLQDLCAQVSEQFDAVCQRRRLRVRAAIDPAARTVRSDRVLLELVLRNLVENATKFAREETEIVIKAVPAGIPMDPVNPPPPEADLARGVRLTVRDEGLGIPLAHQQRIFERFYQVDRARTGGSVQRGTGLGLAIVKHATRRLGGRVGVESVYQQGTTMIVELPRCVGG